LSKFSLKHRFISIVLAAVILLPYAAIADESGYSFTDLDIPIEPVTGSEEAPYTENLWDVTEGGIYDENGVEQAGFEPDVPREVSREEEELPQVPELADSFEQYRDALISSWGGKRSFAEQRLAGVKQNLEDQKKRFEAMKKEIALTEEALVPIREQVEELQGQIELINDQIRQTREKITNVEVMIAEKQIEIKDSLLFLQRAEIEMEVQKKIVLDYVKLLYQEESKFFDLYDDGSSTLKLLLADNSVSENLVGAEYFAIMEETGRKVFYDLDRRRQELQKRQEEILEEQEDLKFLYDQLTLEKKTYEESRLAKKDLLEKTQGEQEKYELLLEQALQQQLESAIAVQNLQDNIETIENKLSVLDDGIEEAQTVTAPDDLKEFEEKVNMVESVDGEAVEDITSKSIKPFSWPVPPNKITAEFHDPSYPKKWGLHQAIDIRAKQYTEIHAPANAYVFQTKDNGMGYSYIVLAHKNNFITVYGHVSEILVTPGTIVKKGDVIGLSGGTPGTKGAGLQTTGPHLHFEVYYRGEPVNPLGYLPLEEMPIEYVPDEFLEELK
jgi:murein DD-endopeptidase MepM/ murein hydrolase activator NlpD